jgi:hypothetical protein
MLAALRRDRLPNANQNLNASPEAGVKDSVATEPSRLA